MMDETSPCPETLVSDFLDRCPAAAPVFVRHHMSCVGCTMSKFETLESAAKIYGVSLPLFLHELSECIAND